MTIGYHIDRMLEQLFSKNKNLQSWRIKISDECVYDLIVYQQSLSENQNRDSWVWSTNTTSVLWRPPVPNMNKKKRLLTSQRLKKLHWANWSSPSLEILLISGKLLFLLNWTAGYDFDLNGAATVQVFDLVSSQAVVFTNISPFPCLLFITMQNTWKTIYL